VPSPAPAGSYLVGVAAVSAQSPWAVGYTYPISAGVKTLIERWNGKGWKQVPSPSPAGGQLLAVAASSGRNAWAVGTTGGKILIERWNGVAWK
jgi:hypothetical protein